jgi:hypothetical protein
LDKILGKYSHINVIGCFKEIRELKRQFDRSVERYDANMAKYAATSKLKDPVSYTEVGYSLYESKKAYHCICLEFVYKTSTLKGMIDPIISLQLLPAFSELFDLYSENSQIVVSLIDASKSFHNRWTENQSGFTGESLLAAHNQCRESFLKELKPDTYSPIKRESSTTLLHGINLCEKEGYLFRKVEQKWSRKYFFVSENHFKSFNISKPASATHDHIDMPLKSCNIQTSITEDRRFCFELVWPTITLLLQAESELDLKSWLETIEISKQAVVKVNPKETMETSKSSYFEQPSLGYKVKLEDSGSGFSLDGVQKENVTYSNPNLLKKNQELHFLLKSVPNSDFVIDSFTAALESDILSQGKVFLTQTRICFYSNILGFVNNVSIINLGGYAFQGHY